MRSIKRLQTLFAGVAFSPDQSWKKALFMRLSIFVVGLLESERMLLRHSWCSTSATGAFGSSRSSASR